jgi:hypothetical protein
LYNIGEIYEHSDYYREDPYNKYPASDYQKRQHTSNAFHRFIPSHNGLTFAVAALA